MILCPKEFAIPADRQAEANVSYGEPSVFRERDATEFCWDCVSHAQQLIYCSFGTRYLRYPLASTLLRRVVNAFAQLPDCQLVVSAGDAVRVLESSCLPPNVQLHRKPPQLELLEKASLFITHGGLGGVKESLLSGTPMLVVPFDTDQPSNAERVRYHNLGRVLAAPRCHARAAVRDDSIDPPGSG